MESGNPRIEWLQKSGMNYLKFTFKDTLTEEMARTAIKKWREAFQSKSGQKITLVWDCLEMAGYDTGSRHQWQIALKEMKDQIETVWLITKSNIVQMGASVMSLFSTLEIKTVSSESEIQ
jgi:hypothetical protein